ncbi:SPL family radical SAM protein [Agathobaculum sp.]|uniref:SPL family radical SAM protein n=1 Tax=Agathobaculum sp. TaxID=2048138 RepID=UPI002A81C42C|nr:radical SAM protein [Agathobaculum sp.]MDY3619349.1 radical SAM protein [Agathobaculum sp.]
MTPREITCAAAFRRVSGRFPYHWDLNPYRGCAHRCQYCFAVYSHRYLDSSAFYDEIFVKTNIVEQLERQLSRPDWPSEVVNIGGVTDSYQPLEATYRLMPDILRLFIKYQTPCIISTKSDLILRDFDLIDELSRITFVNIASTVTTVDERVRQRLEPGGVPSQRRLAMLKAFSKTNCATGMHAMPIVPYLTDSPENLEGLCAGASDAHVDYLLTGAMYLRGNTRNVFFDFIKRDYPTLYAPLSALYRKGALDKTYKAQLYQTVGRLRAKYGLTGNYQAIMKAKLPQAPEQLSLF